MSASDQNAEFNNIVNNGEDLGWPATKSKDLDGQSLLLDSDADTHITADTDDRVDFALGGFDGFRLDGTTASSVNGFDIATTATGVAPIIKSQGEANVGWELQDSNGNEIVTGASTASAVNEVTVTNAAIGNAPAISATGGDTNIDINLVPKGSGQVDIGSGGATQAEQETGTATDKIVTPGRQHFSQSAAKFWVKHDDGTTINASFNVTSITDTGTGDHTVNFTTAFSTANYAVVALSANVTYSHQDATAAAAGSVRIQTTNDAGTLTDAVRYFVAGFGDQ